MKVVLGISGASGMVLAKSAIEFLSSEHQLFVIATENGERVFEHEIGIPLYDFVRNFYNVTRYSDQNVFAPLSSGSFIADRMIILPCSCAAMGKMANGCGNGLLYRCADVFIKERRPISVCIREMPLSSPVLRNLLNLSESGVKVIPICPPFYADSKNIEDLYIKTLGRILLSCGINNNLYMKWGDTY